MNEKIVCTIVTKNYLAYARALAISLTEHNPSIKLYVLLADRIDGYFDPGKEPFELIRLEDLPDQQVIQIMCFYYTPFEFCNALRGMLHEYIYEQKIATYWIYLDSDILIYNSLEVIFKLLEDSSILLNPHIIEPVNQSNLDGIEVKILVSGIYNSGFLGLKRTNETRKFIKWFKQRLIHYCFQRRGQEGELFMLSADQLWLNFVPHFFSETAFLVHPGANVGYWNLISDTITKKDNTYFINDQPILFIHFSKWDISQPANLYLLPQSNSILWQEIGEKYKKLLIEYDHEICKQYPYTFKSFNNDKKITLEMRYLFYKSIYSNESEQSWINVDPFKNYDYFKLKILKTKLESFFRSLLKIYDYSYLNAKIEQKTKKPFIYELSQKLARLCEKIISMSA